MNASVIRLSAVVCAIGWQTVSPAQPGKAGASGNRSIEPGDLGKTAIPVSPKDGPLPLAIRWWGQACVSIETFWGLTVVIDPYPASDRLGYARLDLTADLVLITHEHFDHTGVKSIKGKPVVLRGLTPDGDWTKIDHYFDRPPNRPKPVLVPQSDVKRLSPYAVHIRGIPIFHDDQSGARRGKNMMLLIEADGVLVLHCGDLGHPLTDEQIETIGPVDVLLVPVGGTYTIDGAGALHVSRQLKCRRWIWPIHYNTEVGRVPLAKVDPFLELAKKADISVRRVKGNAAAITRRPPGRADDAALPAVLVSDWKPVQIKPQVAKALAAMRKDRRALIKTLGKVSKTQLDHKPSNGTHTIRWNFEHTTGRELGFFSQVYHALDPAIPVINWNPAQMPPDFIPRYPEWDTARASAHR